MVWMPEPGRIVGASGRTYARTDADEPIVAGGIGGKAFAPDAGATTINLNVDVHGLTEGDAGRKIGLAIARELDGRTRLGYRLRP
jgi:hypothetical protein